MAQDRTGVKRALLIATLFPPMTGPEAMLSAKRLGNMPGWQVDVVTLAPYPGSGDDPETGTYAASHFGRIERLAAPWPCRLPVYATWPLFRLPDPVRWAKSRLASRALAMGLKNYDALVSWSNWQSSHLVGLELKRQFPALPWLAHFSDPWARNPYNRYGAILRRLNFALERKVLAAADALTFTTRETVDLMLADAPPEWRRKAHILPHAFDPDLYPPAPAMPEGGRVIARHLGYFYGPRSPRPLLAGLQLLHERAPALLDNLTIELVGGFGRGHVPGDELAGLPAGLIRVLPPVSYRRSLELMHGADLLIAVDAPAKVSVFLPSKLIDYVGAGRPILAITPPGAAAAVVERIGGWHADPNDPPGVAAALERALTRVRRARGAPFGDARVRNGYGIATVGRHAATMLDELVAAKTGERA
jgi:glycosyltransferase involved in cell wall biosynthesis